MKFNKNSFFNFDYLIMVNGNKKFFYEKLKFIKENPDKNFLGATFNHRSFSLLDKSTIKKELEYLLIVSEIDLNKSEYNNNSKVLDKYNEIFNSSLVSASIKERVKKIHEFQLYK